MKQFCCWRNCPCLHNIELCLMIRCMEFESGRHECLLFTDITSKRLMLICSLWSFAASFAVSVSWSMACNPVLISHKLYSLCLKLDVTDLSRFACIYATKCAWIHAYLDKSATSNSGKREYNVSESQTMYYFESLRTHISHFPLIDCIMTIWMLRVQWPSQQVPRGALGIRELYIRRHTEVHQMKFSDPLSSIYYLDHNESAPSHLMLGRNDVWFSQVSENPTVLCVIDWADLMFWLSTANSCSIKSLFWWANQHIPCNFFCAGPSSQKIEAWLSGHGIDGNLQVS
jgi:hypothetical protein